jgi:hypothetical protein
MVVTGVAGARCRPDQPPADQDVLNRVAMKGGKEVLQVYEFAVFTPKIGRLHAELNIATFQNFIQSSAKKLPANLAISLQGVVNMFLILSRRFGKKTGFQNERFRHTSCRR